MTDEISIQQGVNEYPQRQGNYAVPGAIVAGGLGAAGGVAGAHYKNWGVKYDKPDLEKVFAQDPDTFDSQIKRADGDNKNFLEAAKKQAQKIKDADAEYERQITELMAEKTETTPATVPQNLLDTQKAAQTAYDNELNTLIESEKKKLGGKPITRLTKFPTPEEMRLGIPSTGDAATISADWAKYDSTLRPAFENARNNVIYDVTGAVDGSNRYTAAKKNLATFRTSVDEYYQDVADAARETDKKEQLKKVNNAKAKLRGIVEREFPIDPKTFDTEIIEKAFKDGKMVEAKGIFSGLTTLYTNPKNGKNYTFADTPAIGGKGKTFEALKKAEEERINGLRAALENEIIATQESYVKASKDIAEFEKRSVFKKKGPHGGTKTFPNYVCEITDVTADDSVKVYEKELATMKKLADPKQASKVPAADINALTAKYGVDPTKTANAESVTKQIETRLALAREYANLDTVKKAAMGGQSRVALYEAEMERAIMSNGDVQKAKRNIEKLAKKYGINVETTTTAAADIEAQAKTAAEKALEGKTVATELKAANEAVEQFKKDHPGETKTVKLTREQAIEKFGKSKEEFTKGIKENAEKELKSYLEKAKFANKTWTGIAAAAGLAVVGGLIGMAAKKDQA